MTNVLIVAEIKSFYINVIKEKLEQMSYRVHLLPADTDALHKFSEVIHGIIIYTDEKLLQQLQPLSFLKDKAIANDVPVFVIGDHDELKAISGIIPRQIIFHEFLRPIDIPAAVKKLDEFIKRHSMQKKILVVDDSGAMLRNVKGWLEDRYNVFLANSGAMAIKYLSLNRPDLVLLDYEMPVVDGKQVLEMIRTEAEFADIPVIFLTGKDSKEYVMNVQGLKPEGYLLKTMEPSQIVKAINDFFEKRKGLLL
ncbi:MAG: response regulator [Clostridiales bacterium]|jgi:CheY-like chemotaxis protein|nr:response regulator [Clostridiales bacterium]